MAVEDWVVKAENLRTYFFLEEGTLKAVDGVSFSVGTKQTLGIIGESGCGKSVTAQSILRIEPDPGRIVAGKIHFKNKNVDTDLVSLHKQGETIRGIRGRDISMIFQEPMTSLSPVHTVGAQISEAILLHRTSDKNEARQITLDMLDRVGISNPPQRIDEYAHQLSGGMRQRVMIAIALSCNPTLLIADEPTTALDVTVQAQIIELMQALQEQFGMSTLYITHDLGVMAEIADEVVVMYLGRVVEQAPTRELFKNPQHPYTQLLLKSIPKIGRKARVRLDTIQGTVPLPLDPPWQCGFFSRCPEAIAGTCDGAVPALVDVAPNHKVRCFLRADAVEENPGLAFDKRGRPVEAVSAGSQQE